MNITVERDHLIHALTPCATVATTKGAQPILACVLLSATGSTLTASATDLICGVRRTCDAKVNSPGKAAVAARDLLDRVKVMPAGPLTIVATADSLTMTVKNRKHVLRCFAAAESVVVVVPEPKTDGIKVLASAFLGAMDEAAAAASRDTTRPGTNAVSVLWRDGNLLMRGASNEWFASVSVPMASKVPTLLLPLESTVALRRVLDTSGDIIVSDDGARAYFVSDRTLFSTALPNADTPPLDLYINERQRLTKRAIVDKQELLSAVKSVQLAAGKGELGGVVQLRFGLGSLKIRAESKESNSAADDSLDATCETPGKANVNAPHLLTALAACDDERVVIDFGDGVDPVFVTPEKGDGYLAILMPLADP